MEAPTMDCRFNSYLGHFSEKKGETKIMTTAVKLFFTTLFIFLTIDLIWLLGLSKKLYHSYLGELMGSPKIIPALIFYFIYVIAILFFVIYPSLEKSSLWYALLAGGFLGFVCYGTYDLTNLATLKNWPALITSIDLLWGTFVTGITSGAVYMIASYFKWV